MQFETINVGIAGKLATCLGTAQTKGKEKERHPKGIQKEGIGAQMERDPRGPKERDSKKGIGTLGRPRAKGNTSKGKAREMGKREEAKRDVNTQRADDSSVGG